MTWFGGRRVGDQVFAALCQGVFFCIDAVAAQLACFAFPFFL